MKEYTREDILALLESIASRLDTEWNGDSDTYEASIAYNESAEVVRSYKGDYE